jgi:hypothetical protein
MGLFEVPKTCKTEFEELVSKDASLWEAIHTLSNFHVDIIINSFFAQSLMFNDIVGNQPPCHFHILISIKRCLKIHFFDVGAAELGLGHADNAFPHDFR